jgi:hypothetical protein
MFIHGRKNDRKHSIVEHRIKTRNLEMVVQIAMTDTNRNYPNALMPASFHVGIAALL